jgi:hypothetical protein
VCELNDPPRSFPFPRIDSGRYDPAILDAVPHADLGFVRGTPAGSNFPTWGGVFSPNATLGGLEAESEFLVFLACLQRLRWSGRSLECGLRGLMHCVVLMGRSMFKHRKGVIIQQAYAVLIKANTAKSQGIVTGCKSLDRSSKTWG